MISDIFLTFLYWVAYVATLPARILPTATLSEEVAGVMSVVSSYLTSLNFLIPVGTIGSIFVLILALEAGIMTLKIINWIIRKIPGIN